MNYTDLARSIAKDAGMREWLPLPDNDYMFARANDDLMIIEAAMPYNDATLAVFAHEAGHLATNSNERKREGMRLYQLEALATKWAREAVKRFGGTVTPTMERVWRITLATYKNRDPEFSHAVIKELKTHV